MERIGEAELMNKEMLMKIHDVLECEGDVKMGSWASGSRVTKCGTVGCIAGWAMIINGDTKKNGDLKAAVYAACGGDEEARGMELLGLTEEQANRLFYVQNWPEDLEDRYIDVHEEYTSSGRAAREARVRIVQERIKRFIESEGRE